MRWLSQRIGLESALAALSCFALSALLVGSLPAEANANSAAEAHVSSTQEDNLKRQSLIPQGVDQPSGVTSGCVTNPFPAQPSGASYSAEFVNNTFTGARGFTVSAWREACVSDPSRSAVFIRYFPPSGQYIFVCGGGGALDATQNGRLYNSLFESSRYSPPSSNSFCGYVYSPTTFLIDQWQWSFYPNFDDQGAFTLRYGYNNANQLTVPIWNPTAIRRNLTVQMTGSGAGQVNSSPSGIACTSGTCRAEFYEGTTVTLTAIPSGAARFAGSYRQKLVTA